MLGGLYELVMNKTLRMHSFGSIAAVVTIPVSPRVHALVRTDLLFAIVAFFFVFCFLLLNSCPLSEFYFKEPIVACHRRA